MAVRERPLSPHLQVYRFAYTMALSILHRATGIALSAGLLVLAWWLVAAAAGEEAYALVRSCLGSLPGQVVLVGASFAFFYHLCAGLRHLAWDLGYGFEKATARRSGAAVVAGAIALTALLWSLLVGGAA
ncbi:MAG: succinate dehydrogenase, cytochrome b556 subunit [Gammaproteobacteria bacterium]